MFTFLARHPKFRLFLIVLVIITDLIFLVLGLPQAIKFSPITALGIFLCLVFGPAYGIVLTLCIYIYKKDQFQTQEIETTTLLLTVNSFSSMVTITGFKYLYSNSSFSQISELFTPTMTGELANILILGLLFASSSLATWIIQSYLCHKLISRAKS